MSPVNVPQNPTPAPATGVGRVIEETRRHHLPSGRVYEVVKYTEIYRDVTGAIVTGSVYEARPGLDCCSPQDLNDVAECFRCLRVVCSRHSFTCSLCGLVACGACSEEIITEAGRQRVCKHCAADVKPGVVNFLRKIIWG